MEAIYPDAAREQQLEGNVELELTIGADGRVTDAGVVTPAGHGFDEAALQAVKAFLFEPARRNWEAVVSRIRYLYVFELKTQDVATLTTGSLVGRLVSAIGEEPVAYAQVELLGPDGVLLRATQSTTDGSFRFDDLTPGKYLVDVYAAEFGTVSQYETVRETEATEVMYRLGRPEVEKSPFGATAVIDPPPREVVRRTLRGQELTSIAGTRGDALRAIEILPGVARPPLGIGALIIRGAAPTDSEVFLEGVSVPLLYHFGGLTSFINSTLLEEIQFYPGNFSTRYGRRLGGVVEIATRDPATDKAHGYAELSVIDASTIWEGPIGDKVSIAAAVRRSIIDLAFDAFAPSSVGVTQAPVYYDYQLFLTWRPTNKDRVRFLIYGSNDRLKLFLEEALGDDPAIRGRTGFNAAFYYHQATWERKINKRVEQEIQISAGPNKIGLGLGEAFAFNGTFIQLYGRSEWRVQISPEVRMIFGSDVLVSPGSFQFLGPQPRQVEGGGSFNPLAGEDAVLVEDDNFLSARPGLYVESHLQLGQRVQLNLGTRVDYYSEIDEWSFDPRTTLVLSVRDNLRVKTGLGLYSQPPEFPESNPEVGNPNLEPIKSVHAGAGVEYDVQDGFTLGVEGFYKYLWDRVVATDFALEPFFDNAGIGRIYGMELSAQIRPGGRSFFGYFSYTLSKSERRDRPGDSWRAFDFDQRHIFTAAFTYDFKRNWQLGGTLRIVGGNPFTPVVGSVFDTQDGVYFPIDGDINSERNPVFHRLDVRVQKTWVFDRWKLALFLDIQNAYNQQNQEGLIYNYDFSESTPLKGLPVIPSIGIRGGM